MRVISEKAILKFAERHPEAKLPLEGWSTIMKQEVFKNFSELRKTFPKIDKIGKCTVFILGGNKFRLIAAIHYNKKSL